MNARANVGIFLLAILVAAPCWAHHHPSMFDLEQRFNKTGRLAKLDWRNPHIYLTVETEGDHGKLEAWSFEGPPPAFFRSREFTKEDIEASLGKIVTVEASRARDGSNSGLIRQMTLTDGRVVSACPQNC